MDIVNVSHHLHQPSLYWIVCVLYVREREREREPLYVFVHERKGQADRDYVHHWMCIGVCKSVLCLALSPLPVYVPMDPMSHNSLQHVKSIRDG